MKQDRLYKVFEILIEVGCVINKLVEYSNYSNITILARKDLVHAIEINLRELLSIEKD